MSPGGGYLSPEPEVHLPNVPFSSRNVFAVLWSPHSVNNTITNPSSNQTQRVQYATEGIAPHRTLTIEWIVGSSIEVSSNVWQQDNSKHYRFWATFFEDAPQKFRYTYWDVSDGGIGATVGAENEHDEAVQFAGEEFDVHGHEITSGLVLDYDYETNSFVASTIWNGLC